MPKLSQQHIKNLRVSLPPISEQIYLVASVAEHSKPLIRAINRAEREVALLREYQTRLIADVVTGKFDVRVAAAALPDLASYDLDFSFGEADEDPEGDDTTEESM